MSLPAHYRPDRKYKSPDRRSLMMLAEFLKAAASQVLVEGAPVGADGFPVPPYSIGARAGHNHRPRRRLMLTAAPAGGIRRAIGGVNQGASVS
jgi:hypothetical protein